MIHWNLRGLTIKIDFLFVAVVTFFLLSDKTGVACLALLACFIHETAHLIAFFLMGVTPKVLSFEVTGIRLVKPDDTLSFRKEIIILLAGSFLNLLLFFLLWYLPSCRAGQNLFAVIHLLVGLFNLLPLLSFDGGKLTYLFCLRFFGEYKADRISSFLDLTTTLLLLVFTFFSFWKGQRSITPLFLSAGLLISLLAKLKQQTKISNG